MTQQRQQSPNQDEAIVRLGVTDGIAEQFEAFEWDFAGYDIAHFVGDLKDLKRAVAVLSAELQPQLSTLETIKLAVDRDDQQTYLVLVLKESFEHLQVSLDQALKDAKYAYTLERLTHRIIPVQDLPERGDLVIPVEAIDYLTEPIVFNSLSIETDEESFYHTF